MHARLCVRGLPLAGMGRLVGDAPRERQVHRVSSTGRRSLGMDEYGERRGVGVRMNGKKSAHQVPARGGIEQDTFSGWRHVLCYLATSRIKQWAKRQYSRRQRRQVRRELADPDMGMDVRPEFAEQLAEQAARVAAGERGTPLDDVLDVVRGNV